MKLYPPPQQPYQPSAYDPPFTPRYSVPEAFRRALSYEGQQHWLAGLCNEMALFAEYIHNVWIVDSTEEVVTNSQLTDMLDCIVSFNVAWPDMPDHPSESSIAEQSRLNEEIPDWAKHVTVKEGDVVAVRVFDHEDGRLCYAVGVLLNACRCTYPETWQVKVLMVVHDLSMRVSNLERRMSQAEKDIIDLKARCTTLEKRVTDLEGRVTSLETRVSTIESTIEKIQGDITSIKNRLTSVENRLTTVEGDITNIKSRLTTIEGKVANIETSIKNIQDSMPDMSLYVTKVDYNAKMAALDATDNKMTNWIQAIIDKIFGGGTKNADGSIAWPTTDKVAIGNMNLYGGDSNAIKTREGDVSSGSDNDVRVV